MELRRFFVEPNDMEGNIITVRGDEFLHLKNVLRMKVGFKLIICLNDGSDRYCEILSIDKDCAVCKVENVVVCEKPRDVKITLFPAILKNNKLDFVIQKAVELGVDEIIPFTSKNTNETKFAVERANKIALEAAKQCGSSTLTRVLSMTTFEDITSRLSQFDNVIMPYEDERNLAFKKAEFKGSNFAVIIGSEGGFTAEEVEFAKLKGAQIVSLGERILRADTASIVSIALLMNELGELSR